MKPVSKKQVLVLSVLAGLIVMACCEAAYLVHRASLLPASTEEAVSEPESVVADRQEDGTVQDRPVPDAHSKYVICIDPGHTAYPDSSQVPIGPGAAKTRPVEPGGTAGVATGVPEYQVNLDVALKLKQDLLDKGFTVVMVRENNDGSISSKDRAQVANDAHADLFVRLHCDSAGSETSGFLTLVPADNAWTDDIYQKSSKAGTYLHNQIVSSLKAHDRGVVERDDLAGFNWCKVPVVLFEMGCMSNPDEDRKLASDEYQQQLARSMADAIASYFDSGAGQ